MDCPDGTEPPPCFVAGDLRVNEQAGLSVMHTIWVREHNRIATIVRSFNPDFTSDQVFLTTRQIVASIIQKITFQDFIPILIGDLFIKLVPPYEGYNPEVDPSIPNSFATAAYRYGHSQIQPFFERLDENYESIPAGPLPLVDAFFDTSHVREFGTDPLVRGLLEKPARQVDEFLNDILTNQLFAPDATSPGLDLAAINIQRGRDHGLPPYLVWKQWAKERCDLESDFAHELTEIHLYQAYGNLDSVDLFVGGLSEAPLPGGLVGAVFGCIFADTFKNLRDGDRFYYENTESGPLNEVQRMEIERATLSRVLCDNTDIAEIQPNAFLSGSRIPCDALPEIDFNAYFGSPPPPPPPPSPICFIRVETTSTDGVIISSSGRNPVPPGGASFLLERRPLSDRNDPCYPVFCSPPIGVSTIAVSPGFECVPDVNSLLPASTSPDPNTYIAQFNPSMQFSNDFADGIYADEDACMAPGSLPALEFNCARRLATSQHAAGDFVHVETNSIDLIRDLAGDVVTQAMLSPSAAASDEDKLASLMEEVLEELKTG